PRRTVARSTDSRTGWRAAAIVRSGCQNAAARPATGAEATNSAPPTAAAPIPAATPRRVPRASARRIPGAARSTTVAARASASAAGRAVSAGWPRPVPSPGGAHGVRVEIHAHAQRGLMQFGRVVVDLGVLPPVAQVRLIGIVYDQTVTQKNAEPLRRQAVVLVDLGDALRERIGYVIDRVCQRNFNERVVGKHARDLASERLVHA